MGARTTSLDKASLALVGTRERKEVSNNDYYSRDPSLMAVELFEASSQQVQLLQSRVSPKEELFSFHAFTSQASPKQFYFPQDQYRYHQNKQDYNSSCKEMNTSGGTVRIKEKAVEDLKESRLSGIGYKCPVIRNVSSISLKRQKQSA